MPINYHHGITTINEPLEDNTINLKSSTTIGLVVESSEQNLYFMDCANKATMLEILEARKTPNFFSNYQNNKTTNPTEAKKAELQFIVETMADINSNVKIIISTIPPIAETEKNHKKNPPKETLAQVIKNQVLAAVANFENSELKFGVKPDILLAPNFDDLEITQALITTGEKLNAFVYANFTSAIFLKEQAKIKKIIDDANKINAGTYAEDYSLLVSDYEKLAKLKDTNNEKILNNFLAKNPTLITDYLKEFEKAKNISFLYSGNFNIKIKEYFENINTFAKTQTVKQSSLILAAAARSFVDAQFGWHKSLSNIEGLFKNLVVLFEDLDFYHFLPIQEIKSSENTAPDFTDTLNEKGVLLFKSAKDLTIWGSRTTYKKNADYLFETYTRTEFKLKEIIANGIKWAVDKPLTAGLVNDVVNIIEQAFADLVTQGKLLGAKIWIKKPANNSEQDELKEQIKTGTFAFNYKFTPVPPLEQLHLKHTITGEYIEDLIKAIK